MYYIREIINFWPQTKIQVEKLRIPDYTLVELADFQNPAKIYILATADTYYALLLNCIIHLGKGLI